MSEWLSLTKPNGDPILVNLAMATDIVRLRDKSRINFGEGYSIEVLEGLTALNAMSKEAQLADRT